MRIEFSIDNLKEYLNKVVLEPLLRNAYDKIIYLQSDEVKMMGGYCRYVSVREDFLSYVEVKLNSTLQNLSMLNVNYGIHHLICDDTNNTVQDINNDNIVIDIELINSGRGSNCISWRRSFKEINES